MKTALILLALLLSACGGNTSGNASINERANNNVEPPAQTPTSSPDLKLEKQFAEIGADAKGRVGVYAVVMETDESAALNAGERFAMQSVVKLPISMAVLKLVDEGKLKLDQKIAVTKDDHVPSNMRSPIRDSNPDGGEMTVRELIRYAISESDGTASDVLQRVAGGAKGVQEFIDLIDVREMKVKHTHKEFGAKWELQYENWASPQAACELLYMLWLASPNEGRSTRHSQQSFEILEKFMTESNNPTNRLKGLLPPGTPVAHKTGTGGTRNGITSATNDIGIITLPNGNHIAIAVFVADSPADERTREAVIAKIAKAVWDRWSVQKKPETEPAGNPIDFNLRHSLG